MSKKAYAFLILMVVLVVLLPPPSCHAQSAHRKGQGYVFFAPGVATAPFATNGIFQVGAGGERFLHKGLAVGGEGGYLAPFEAVGDGFGVASGDGSYHFNRGKKAVPFVSAGYSLLFRSGVANAVNYGGGVNCWFKDRLGVRLEFRDHYVPSFTEHYVTFRVGLSF